MSFSLIVGLVAGLWIGRDVRRRGGDISMAVLWGVGCLVMWYIAVPVYFLFGRRKRLPVRGEPAARKRTPIDVSEKIVCPRCASMVPESFSRCPHCGISLKED